MDGAAERGTRRQHLDGGACAPVSVFCSSGPTPLFAVSLVCGLSLTPEIEEKIFGRDFRSRISG